MDLTGRRLGHYQIAEEISRGGMGVVYRATDVRLNRDVALKVLPDDLTHDPERRRRFLQEAKAASALEHPHIAVIHEADEVDGHAFIAMELIRGEKLSALLQRQKLAASRALEIASEVAAGLARAHDKGIVHRDLKPANVMITEEGHAKIIDFGIAKLIETAVAGDQPTRTAEGTDAGVVLGTMTYMSPEQARGDRVDHRSDVFSFGILLHEMLAGHPPFQGKSGIETASAIIHAPAPRLPALGPAVVPEASADIQRIVDKCLAKDPADRYQGMKDLGVDLRAARRRLESTTTHVPARSGRKWNPIYAGAAAVTVLVVAGAMWSMRDRAAQPAADTIDVKSSSKPTIAVLYFDNTSGDKELDWLRTGITEMVVTDLSQSQSLEVVGTDRLYGILAQMRRADDKTLSPDVVREIAERTGADNVIVGSYMKAGEAVRINLRLQEARTGKIVTSERVEGPNTSSLFTMVDDLSRRIRTRFEALRAGLSDPSSLLAKPGASAADGLDRGLGDVTTSSIDAYRQFAEGVYLHERFREAEAAEHFEKAVSIDPQFAMAYTKLAVAQYNLGHRDLADKYASIALKNSDRLTPRERFYIEGYYYGHRPATFARSMDAYQKCVDLDAGHQACRHNLALGLSLIERDAEAAAQYEELLRRGTTTPSVFSNLATRYWRLDQVAKATALSQSFLKRNPELAAAHRGYAGALVVEGRFEEALQEFDRAELLDARDPTVPLARGITQSLRGDWAGARATAAKLSASPDEARRWFGAIIDVTVAALNGKSRDALAGAHRAVAAFKTPGERTSDGHRLAGAVYAERGEYAKALAELRRAIADGKGLLGENAALAEAAVVHALLGQFKDSDDLVARLEALATPLTEVVTNRTVAKTRGRIATIRKQYSEAIAQLSKAQSALSPAVGNPFAPTDHLSIWFALGDAYVNAGKPAEARPWFERVATNKHGYAATPLEYVRSYYFLGRIHEQGGDMPKAREYYRRFVEFWKDGDLDRDRVAEAERKLRGQS